MRELRGTIRRSFSSLPSPTTRFARAERRSHLLPGQALRRAETDKVPRHRAAEATYSEERTAEPIIRKSTLILCLLCSAGSRFNRLSNY